MRTRWFAAVLVLGTLLAACSAGDDHNSSPAVPASADGTAVVGSAPDEGVPDDILRAAVEVKLAEQDAVPCAADLLVASAANGNYGRSDLLNWSLGQPVDEAISSAIESYLTVIVCP